MEKLKYKSKHKLDFSEEMDFLETILRDYGVEDIDTFLHPKEKSENDPFLFKNMKKAITTLHNVLEKDKTIFIKGDCDVDGATSLAILVQFIKSIKPNVNLIYKTDYNKRHGLFFNDIKDEENIGLIFVPDASLTLEESGKIRKEDKFVDIPIIVLDHHEINEEMDTITTILVNCMDGKYPNNTLSGAGVVYKFCEAYCQQYGIDKSYYKKYIDLVAIGIISDSMDLRQEETRYLVMEGLKKENYNNKFLNELQDLFSDEIKFGRTIEVVGWVLAPKINGVIRYGKQKEQDDLFRAICGEEEIIEYQPRRKNKEDPKPPIEYHSLQKTMARISRNVKERQDTEVRKFVTNIEDEIQKKDLLKNSVLFVNGTDIITKNTVTGLIANKLASKYQRPVILLKEYTDNSFGGSGRGYDKGNVENFKDVINNIGVFNKAMGHQSAFGVEINKDKVDEAIKLCNEAIPIESLCTIYNVDWEIEGIKLKEQDIKEVAENYAIWGNSVPEPVFAIKNLHINASDINGYGENNNFIRFVYRDIAFIKKYCSHDEYENMTCWTRKIMGKNKKDLTINIIGKFVLNSWEDKITPQVKILYFDSVENVEKEGLHDSQNPVHTSSKIKRKENKEDPFISEDEKEVKENKINTLDKEFGDFIF